VIVGPSPRRPKGYSLVRERGRPVDTTAAATAAADRAGNRLTSRGPEWP
jgi:hypothetical protein